MSGELRIYFGDIHNHNSYGYGLGSLGRSIDIARTHLDFFAFTGHASWHDMAPMEGGREQHWLAGFARLKAGWPEVQQAIAEANEDGRFSAFLGFEWHSSRYGDQCVIFPGDHKPLHETDTVARLRDFARGHDALMIPHHLAYPTGMRGVNWAAFTPECTPVVEVFSEHGNATDDRGPYPYLSHSMGGRVTANTAEAALARGLRFGFVGSSDDHRGFPGAYGEGVMAALCTELSRAAVFEAIRARRTYALTGDRIEIDFSADGNPMGAALRTGAQAEIIYDVHGRDEMEVVEIVQDGHVVHRGFPETQVAPEQVWRAPFQLRLEWGWGPWGDLALERIADWEFHLRVSEGRISRVFPCLQSGPFDEERRHRFRQVSPRELFITSYASRAGGYRDNPNQSVVLEIDGDARTRFDLAMTRPAEARMETTAQALLAGSRSLRAGPFPKESCQWHRLVPLAAARVRGRAVLDVPEGGGYAYLRARQRNGQMAWASPVFFERGTMGSGGA